MRIQASGKPEKVGLQMSLDYQVILGALRILRDVEEMR